MKPIIHSTKHIVQLSLTAIAGGAAQSFNIANAVAVSDKNTVAEVEEGAAIKAVFIELWGKGGIASNLASAQMIFCKLPSGVGTATTVEMAALGDWDNKKNIFYTTQGLFSDEAQNPRIIMKQWFKIPKGKQRMGLGDVLEVRAFAPAVDFDWCGFATYKEYT